jgi:hypothetical protein
MATLAEGNAEGAAPYLKEALSLATELEDKFMLRATLTCFAVFSLAQARPAQAMRLAGASAAIAETAAFILPKARQVGLKRLMEAAGRALAPGAAAAAWSQGRATPLAQLIADALEEATA